MNHFVIIFSTVITALNEVNQMHITLGNFKNIVTWSCDLEDEDKVLRIVSTEDISQQLTAALRQAGVVSKVLGVFTPDNPDNI